MKNEAPKAFILHTGYGFYSLNIFAYRRELFLFGIAILQLHHH